MYLDHCAFISFNACHLLPLFSGEDSRYCLVFLGLSSTFIPGSKSIIFQRHLKAGLLKVGNRLYVNFSQVKGAGRRAS